MKLKFVSIIVLLVVVASMSVHAHAKKSTQVLWLPVISIYDGDTIKTSLPLPIPLNKVSVRIYGIDTPEKPAKSYYTTGKLGRAKCIKEAELALAATSYLKSLFGDVGVMEVRNFSYGKYGGRFIGEVFVGGLSVADKLIANGYARPYFGGKKTGWCN